MTVIVSGKRLHKIRSWTSIIIQSSMSNLTSIRLMGWKDSTLQILTSFSPAVRSFYKDIHLSTLRCLESCIYTNIHLRVLFMAVWAYYNVWNVCYCVYADVPEGSFIVRAHTPMSNLFSCLWFNEVERFTPRDQLSFAYTYQKLRRMNPDKPFYLNMFKVKNSDKKWLQILKLNYY